MGNVLENTRASYKLYTTYEKVKFQEKSKNYSTIPT